MLKVSKKLLPSIIFSCVLFSCKTIDLEQSILTEPVDKNDSNYSDFEEKEYSLEDVDNYFAEEELKEIDIEKSVVYVEKPVYYPVEEKEVRPTGKDAVKKSMDGSVQSPFKYKGGKMFYDYNENQVYEIFCQPYRITDLQLEPGEMILENPFLSESQVWEMGAGVSRKYGQDVQHFYLKPDMSGLTTSMIIITDRRIYNLLLKSFRDCYMPMVEFEYPNTMPFNIKMDAMNEKLEKQLQMNKRKTEVGAIDPKFLSFDYKMSYKIFRKPLWLPKRVYDDGRKTYIQLDEIILHTSTPVLFNHRNERINYRVDKNLIIIDELIEKVTLRLKNETVTIYKKNYKEPVKLNEDEFEEIKEEKKTQKLVERNGQFYHSQFPVKKQEPKAKEKESKEEVKNDN